MLRQTLFLVALTLALFNVAECSTEKVLYNFCSLPHCDDGANPIADLVQDAGGNLWGTTENGGTNGMGTIFELTKRSGYTVLGQVYSFRVGAKDGAHPQAGLVVNLVTGTLYGTTSSGGPPSFCSNGCGTVFAFHPATRTEVVVHFFLGPHCGTNCADGANPTSKLRLDASGKLYGTTSAGGTFNLGTTFKIDTNNTETVIHSFAGFPNDGATPRGGLVFDANQNLWGTTETGGAQNLGSIFEITGAMLTSQTQVYSFRGGFADGAKPVAALAFDPTTGNLYGTTMSGGSTGCPTGCGTVFFINSLTTFYQKLYSFVVGRGEAPVARLAIEPSSGNLYGTASLGGIRSGVCSPGGCGTAFEICAPQNTCSWVGPEYTLFYFNDNNIPHTGRNPMSGLLLDVTIPSLPSDDVDKFPPPSGGRGTCTSNCVAVTTNGGANSAGTVYSLTK